MAKILNNYLVCLVTKNPRHNVLLEGCHQELDVVTFPVAKVEKAKERRESLKGQGKLVQLVRITGVE